MPWVNYHSHSLYCDGKAAPEEYVIQAVKLGFPAWGYSSHAPVPFASTWNMPAENLPGYLDELLAIKAAYAGKIQVYIGLETDYVEGIWDFTISGLKDKPLDYRIGSVHYIGSFPDGTQFCFDGQPEAFFEGVKKVFQNDFRQAITRYYHGVMRMVEVDCPNIVGHLDKIKMHNAVKPYVRETDKWYRHLVEETLEMIKQQDCIVEVNTRGLYKHNPPLLYPGSWILKRLYQKKIPVTINADAHHPDEIANGFAQTAALLLEIGFTNIRVLLDGKWQDKSFDENGLRL